jgi:hypothetical protein
MEQDYECWYANIALWSAFASWAVAQTIKMTIDLYRSHRIDFRYFVSTGGMPSAHSCMASGLATAVGLETGFGSPLFAVALAFAGVVMFDAQSVRRAAGLQARLLNQIVEELFVEKHFSQEKMAELLGHTPVQVFAGCVLGISVAVGLRLAVRGIL